MRPHLLHSAALLCAFTSQILTGSAKAPESPWGVCAHPNQPRERENLDLALQRCIEAGIGWMREDIQFGRIIGDGKRAPDFSFYDELLGKLEKSNLRLLGILQAYDWEIAPHFRPIYQHPEQWRAFVRAVAQRYKGRITHYEVWNEPDEGFWKPRPDAAQYVSILKIAREEIKAADPDATVVLGGLTRWSESYIRDVYAAGGKGHFDVIAVHPYGWGPDASAEAVKGFASLKKVIADNNDENVSVWITECGASTSEPTLRYREPKLVPASIRYALQKLGRPIAPEAPLPVVGLALSPRSEVPADVLQSRSWMAGVQLQPIPFSKLAGLEPEKVPVLFIEGMHVDEPLIAPLADYVRRGGLLLATGWIPLFGVHELRADGSFGPAIDAPKTTQSPFRIDFGAWWDDPRIPRGTTRVRVDPAALAAGLPPVSRGFVDRVLTPKRLQPGDTFTPLVHVLNDAGKEVGAPIALYTYHDKKGAVLAVCTPPGGDFTEAEQARLLPRYYLSYLASGVEKIFWYDLHNDGQNPGEREHHFGLLRWDWSPKPAFLAYQEMTKVLGEIPAFVQRLSGDAADEKVWALVFRRKEDGRHVLAAWCVDENSGYAIQVGDGAPVQIQGDHVTYIPLGETIPPIRLTARR